MRTLCVHREWTEQWKLQPRSILHIDIIGLDKIYECHYWPVTDEEVITTAVSGEAARQVHSLLSGNFNSSDLQMVAVAVWWGERLVRLTYRNVLIVGTLFVQANFFILDFVKRAGAGN